MKPKFLILSGDGINCENETSFCLKESGAETDIIHINQLCERPEQLLNYQGLALPGGFSFGDELGSGKLLSLKLKLKLNDQLLDFKERKNPIIGICNGFQTLVQLGMLPDYNKERSVSLIANEEGAFIDEWVYLEKNIHCDSPWVQDMDSKIHLPIRHAEGRIFLNDTNLYDELYQAGQVALSYEQNVNGSYKNIAALTDPTGLVLGLMPHPEAAYYKATGMELSKNFKEKADGAILFDNIIKFIKQN